MPTVPRGAAVDEDQPIMLANVGIRLVAPVVRQRLSAGEHSDMTDLVTRWVAAGRNVMCIAVWEYRRDIGHGRDYEAALDDVKHGQLHA